MHSGNRLTVLELLAEAEQKLELLKHSLPQGAQLGSPPVHHDKKVQLWLLVCGLHQKCVSKENLSLCNFKTVIVRGFLLILSLESI